MSKPNGKWSCNYQYSQDYPGYLNNQFIYSMNEKFKEERINEKTQKELDLIASIDEMVDKMLTFPDAEAILNKIRRKDD